jgi:hypothetical protein
VIGRRDATLVTDQNPYGDTGIVTEAGWETIDKVLPPETKEFYSSKPPLLPTILAGEYWLLRKGLGWSITDPHGEVIRVILLTVNGLPWLLYLVLMARLADRIGTTDWGRLYVLTAACFATFLTPFAVSLNNHTVAACTAVFALYPALRLWEGPQSSDRYSGRAPALLFLLAGFFAGFTACNELPAASFAVALFGLLLVRFPARASLLYLVAALIPVAAFLWTNYLAVGQLAPAYSEVGGPWYQYAGSHWATPSEARHGIDWADEPKWVYAAHLVVGHHGLFSLTPIFLLALGGMAGGVRGVARGLIGTSTASPSEGPAENGRTTRIIAPLAVVGCLSAVLTVTVVSFYVVKTNNYGGWTSGPRWLMWLTPFLLLSMLPWLDRLSASRRGRGLAYALLALSVLSASYPASNPWRHPWLYDFMEVRGWIRY